MSERASVAEKPRGYLRIMDPMPTSAYFNAFTEVTKASGIKMYGVSPKHITLNEMIGIAETEYIKGGIYLTPSPLKLESIYDESYFKTMFQQPIERSEPIRESISILKPELVGLGLGGALSCGVGIFALATHDTGLATVMAGPFFASILGFTLLLTGLKRKKR